MVVQASGEGAALAADFNEQRVWLEGVGAKLQERASLTANALITPEVDVMPIQLGITIICRRVR